MTAPVPEPPAGPDLAALVGRVRGEARRLSKARGEYQRSDAARKWGSHSGEGAVLCGIAAFSPLPADALTLCERAGRLERAARAALDTLELKAFEHTADCPCETCADTIPALRAALADAPVPRPRMET